MIIIMFLRISEYFGRHFVNINLVEIFSNLYFLDCICLVS